MAKRAFDVVVATVLLAITAPVQAVAAVAVWLADGGAILYPGPRVGRHGSTFAMLKLRTMRPSEGGASITARNDARVTPVGALLRKTKIDELPQLWNVLRGDMSIVGPRPEAPDVVEHHYSAWQRKTLRVRPGLISPGALWYHTHGEALVDDAMPVASYVDRVLPLKLALEEVYIRRSRLRYDLSLIVRTVSVVTARLRGRTEFPAPPELHDAEQVLREVAQAGGDLRSRA